MRDAIATPVFLLLAHAEDVAAWLAAFFTIAAFCMAGGDILLAVPLAVVAAMAVYALTDVYELPGQGRPFSHVCREHADRVADWAGWDWEEL